MELSVIVPTHNPNERNLRRTLEGLEAQTLSSLRREIILVDNASDPPVDLAGSAPPPIDRIRVVREPLLGLTHARRRGLTEATGEVVVFVDDDNVLAPDYLATALALLATHSRIGALGGRSIPEFERTPESWVREFYELLACRDLGASPLVAHARRNSITGRNEYPFCAPIGAGMVLRRAAWTAWADAQVAMDAMSDRRGRALTSGGDNDIVFSVLRAGWEVAYFPQLSLTHLIPAHRVESAYLARLNRGIQKSWMQVLTRHDANPWSPISAWTVPLRQTKAWFAYRAWSSAAARIRWQGACGHFEGRVTPPAARSR